MVRNSIGPDERTNSIRETRSANRSKISESTNLDFEEEALISVSDILKILDKAPIWKTLTQTPKRIEELEARIAALENTKQLPGKSPGEPCPSCGDHALRRTSSVVSTGPFGELGARDEVWTCESCQKTDERLGVR